MKLHLIIFTISCLGFYSFSATAQKSETLSEDRIERLKSQKVAFLSERLELTPAVAQKFWPVYNEFSLRSDSLWHLQKERSCELHDAIDRLTPAQKEAAIDEQMNSRWEKAKLEKAFHQQLKKILTIDQVIKFYDAEYEFKRKLLHLLRETKASYRYNEERIDQGGENHCST